VAARKRLIGSSDQIVERGKGLRFSVEAPDGRAQPAFAVRYRGRVYGYLNRCAHVSVQLDWEEGQFFDVSGLYLVCSTHGAAYYPENGRCAMGPCKGGGLQPLDVVEADGEIYLLGNEELEDV
jgi:nitrite reductase/ring-hydroxylating ferredoxin subunit